MGLVTDTSRHTEGRVRDKNADQGRIRLSIHDRQRTCTAGLKIMRTASDNLEPLLHAREAKCQDEKIATSGPTATQKEETKGPDIIDLSKK
jgi:hypothetical protein